SSQPRQHNSSPTCLSGFGPRRSTMHKQLAIPAAVIAAGLFSTAARADILGFEFGAYRWQADYEGSVRSGSDRLDLEQTLGFDDDDIDVFYAAFEHPLPLIPNLRLQHTKMESSA